MANWIEPLGIQLWNTTSKKVYRIQIAKIKICHFGMALIGTMLMKRKNRT